MPAIYEHRHTATEQEIDGQGHVNNVAYVRWLQDAAVAHSAAQGWSNADYKQAGWAWVVRTHFVEYRRPVSLGDDIVVETWVSNLEKYTSLRKYRVRFVETGKLIASAETNWAFVNRTSGRLCPIPEPVLSAFEIVDDADCPK